MGAIVSIVRQLCLVFFRKNEMDKIKSNPKTQDDAAFIQWGAELSDTEQIIFVHYALATASGPNGCEVSDSMTITLNIIMGALTQPNTIKLGVYGKGTVAEKITRRVKRDNLFDVVVKASLMKKPDLKRIQEELGNMLGLQLHEKTLEGRARLLCDRIKTVEKILIILDDLWGEINLGRIGIPFGTDHKGCKILLISESQEVLSNQMNTQI